MEDLAKIIEEGQKKSGKESPTKGPKTLDGVKFTKEMIDQAQKAGINVVEEEDLDRGYLTTFWFCQGGRKRLPKQFLEMSEQQKEVPQPLSGDVREA